MINGTLRQTNPTGHDMSVIASRSMTRWVRSSRRFKQNASPAPGFRISSVLDQRVENEAIRIVDAPKQTHPTVDRHDDLVGRPIVAATGRA